MLSLPLGILLGMILAVVPGPVAVGAMKMAMNYGQNEGSRYSAGSGFMDVFFCLFAVFATSAVISLFGDFSTNHPILILVFQIVIVIAIVIYGVLQFRSSNHYDSASIDKMEERENNLLKRIGKRGPFFVGFGVGFANIASPTFVPVLAFVTLQIDKFHLYEVSPLNHILLSLGFGLGNFLWLYMIVRLFAKNKEKFSLNFIKNIYKFAGYTLILCGILLGYKVFTLTDWNAIYQIIKL